MTNLDDVFVPGGQPVLTYVSRQDQELDRALTRYKYAPKTQILSVTGPTKSGKTVLLKHYFPDALWLTGGTIETLDSFWQTLADKLEIFTERQLHVDSSRSEAHGTGISGSVGVASAEVSEGRESGVTKATTVGRSRVADSAVREELVRTKQMVVVDDFHYIHERVQGAIVRAIKDLVFDRVPFVFLAVPHRAYDVVKVEKEMTGRVQQLQTGVWSDRDLRSIIVQGFQALNISVSSELLNRLVQESFASPQLMQQFGLNLCLDAGIYTSDHDLENLDDPDWQTFLAQCASHTSRTAFDRLRTGPRQRSDRKPRSLRDGRVTDMYGVVLAAIQLEGARAALSYETLRSAVKQVLDPSEVQPQRQEITRVLEEMTKIAREKIEGEPVLDYETENSILHIADPFFAFYIKNAHHELAPTVEGSNPEPV